MSPPDDPVNDMRRFPSADDSDGILGGQRSPEDFPDEAAPLASLVASMRNHVVAERDAEADRRAIAAIVAGIRGRSLQSVPSRMRLFERSSQLDSPLVGLPYPSWSRSTYQIIHPQASPVIAACTPSSSSSC